MKRHPLFPLLWAIPLLGAIWYISQFEDHSCLSALIFHPIRAWLFILGTPWGWVTNQIIPSWSGGQTYLALLAEFLSTVLLPLCLNGLTIWLLLSKYQSARGSRTAWLLFCILGFTVLCVTRNPDEVNAMFEKHFGSPSVVYSIQYEDWNYRKIISSKVNPLPLLVYLVSWSSVFFFFPKCLHKLKSRAA